MSELTVVINGSPLSRHRVGGKAKSLSRLLALGAPVPPAFCLTTDAYRLVAKHLRLPTDARQTGIDELPSIRAAIEAMPLPPAIADDISMHIETLTAQTSGSFSLAVRSSATAEDSSQFSFAGLHETVLGIQNTTQLEAAIKQCWASLWTERAVEYRRHSGLSSDEAAIAVVVQHLVRSDVSLIVFTTDPVSGRSDRLVINATWGLGESLVSGLVTPDQIVVDDQGRVVQYTVGEKALMIVFDPHSSGSREIVVPRLLREARTLTDQQAQEIAHSVRSLRNRLGFEADLEGGLADGKFYLFQARPITTLRSDLKQAA